MECAGCKRDEEEVDLGERMPCCGARVCWDYCLYLGPKSCPACAGRIVVTPKDPVTKESRVEVREPDYWEDERAIGAVREYLSEWVLGDDSLPSAEAVLQAAARGRGEID